MIQEFEGNRTKDKKYQNMCLLTSWVDLIVKTNRRE